MGLKIGIFAFHLRICVLRSILKKLDVLFLIFLIEFFVSGSFSIEVKYWKKNFNKLNKKKKTKKELEKKYQTCLWNKLYLRFIVFSYHNFFLKIYLRRSSIS